MRQWGKDDIKHANNLAKYIQSAKREMTGAEALGVAFDLQWLSDRIKEAHGELPKDIVQTSLPNAKDPFKESVIKESPKGKKK